MKDKIYYTHSRPDILRLIPKKCKKVLDVGCGEGVLGKKIKEITGAEVSGLEINPAACKKAAANLDKAVQGNVENIEMPFSDGYFDCIIAGDVLEHLQDPWEALKKLRRYLAENGVIVASIPNVRYYKVIIRLFAGYWDYCDSGILDRTHLRFFTLENIKEMFREAGFRIEKIERNIVSARGFRILNYLLLNSLKDFLTYQYYVVAVKAPAFTYAGKRVKAAF